MRVYVSLIALIMLMFIPCASGFSEPIAGVSFAVLCLNVILSFGFLHLRIMFSRVNLVL